mmetsp:Transcript_1299/g.2881  ORF Transcript_1299/g.2881 Transcript_1299/m.2881 type:complete len:243 (-) Transcript_1299:128-856(-)
MRVGGHAGSGRGRLDQRSTEGLDWAGVLCDGDAQRAGSQGDCGDQVDELHHRPGHVGQGHADLRGWEAHVPRHHADGRAPRFPRRGEGVAAVRSRQAQRPAAAAGPGAPRALALQVWVQERRRPRLPGPRRGGVLHDQSIFQVGGGICSRGSADCCRGTAGPGRGAGVQHVPRGAVWERQADERAPHGAAAGARAQQDRQGPCASLSVMAGLGYAVRLRGWDARADSRVMMSLFQASLVSLN